MAEAAACKWCEKGECWTHGQIEKPAGFNGGKKGKGGGKGGFKGGKGDMKGKMKQMFSMMMQMNGGNGDVGGAANNIKGQLKTAYDRSCKGAEKGEVVYETSEVEGQQGKFQSTVSIGEQTFTGEVTAGKKGAEHAAAKAALAEMFPDEAAGGSWGGAPEMPAFMQQAWSKGTQDAFAGGKKRSHDESAAPQPLAAKSRLVHALHLLLGRPATKQDMVWSVEQAEGKHIGSVTLTVMDKTFTGEPASSSKAAENNAADAALEQLADQLAPLQEEHKAKKAKKNSESLAALKLRTEEKKAAKAAAKAEA